MTSLLVIM